jgi:alpha-glucosidase
LHARFGAAPGANASEIQKMLATLLFTTRDAALMYYGDEIGMSTTPPTRVEDVKDPVGITWLAQRKRPRRRAHSHAVDPRQRRRLLHRCHTWLPIPPSYVTT